MGGHIKGIKNHQKTHLWWSMTLCPSWFPDFFCIIHTFGRRSIAMPAHNLISTSHALLQFIIYKWFKQEIQKSCKKINYIKKNYRYLANQSGITQLKSTKQQNQLSMPRPFSLAVSPHTSIIRHHFCWVLLHSNEQEQHSCTYIHTGTWNATSL